MTYAFQVNRQLNANGFSIIFTIQPSYILISLSLNFRMHSPLNADPTLVICRGRERDTVCTAREIQLQLIKVGRDMSKESM